MAAKDLSDQSVSRDDYVTAFRAMLMARLLEDKLRSLYRAGKIIGGVYLGKGQEAFSAAQVHYLDREGGDIFGPVIRDQAGRVGFGEPILDAARTHLGSVKGTMRGRDGNIHRGSPRTGLPAMISHLGSLLPVINGMLIGKRFRGVEGVVASVACGDGATSTGAFHEGMNQAAVENLPVVIGLANNQFAYSTPTDRQYACESLVERAKGYGFEGHECDGTDLGDCLATFKVAVRNAREGNGPQMVVGKLLRLSGHGEHDDASYVPDVLRQEQYGKDCLDHARQVILDEKWASEADLSDWSQECKEEIESAVSKAQSEDSPSPMKENWSPISSSHLLEC